MVRHGRRSTVDLEPRPGLVPLPDIAEPYAARTSPATGTPARRTWSRACATAASRSSNRWCVMPQRVEHADGAEQLDVPVAHALDEHRHVTGLELLHDLAEHVRAGGVDELELRHAQHDDGHAVEPRDLVEHTVGGGEEERPVDADDGDLLVTGLRLARQRLARDPGRRVRGRAARRRRRRPRRWRRRR